MYSLPFADFLIEATALEASLACPSGHRAGPSRWIAITDIGAKLSTLWGIPATPSILILDARGTVLLPPVVLPIHRASGTATIDPRVYETLRRILADTACN